MRASASKGEKIRWEYYAGPGLVASPLEMKPLPRQRKTSEGEAAGRYSAAKDTIDFA